MRVAENRRRGPSNCLSRWGTPGDALEGVADAAQSAAVLIRAGIPPPAVWAYLAEVPSQGRSDQTRNNRPSDLRARRYRARDKLAEDAVLAIIQRIADAGGELSAEAVAAEASRMPTREASAAWRALACVWYVAERSGAPMADCLVSFAESLRSLATTERDVDVAIVGPRSTTRLISALPVVSIAFGWCLGLDAPTVLFTTGAGVACVAVGVALWGAGIWWSRRLIGNARAVRQLAGFELDLVAVAAIGEANHRSACAAVHEAFARCGFTPARELDDSHGVFDLAARAGIPAQSLLRARAEQARRRDRHSSRRAVAKLEVSLVLPLGLCIMPAFIVLGIVPLVMSLFRSTVAELAG